MKPRLFWACCHTMLRITEIPLFCDHGFEVIPTEVTPGVMAEFEGVVYDTHDPVSAIWQASHSLPPDALRILRRSRLWERDGEISPHEADVFNAFIDVIYVPTRFDLAVNLLKWFHGTVIFRYFGHIDAGRGNSEAIKTLSENIRHRLIILPVFRTLLEERMWGSFPYVRVLHNFLDDKTVPQQWVGFDKSASAVIVLGALNSSPSQELIRGLIPLAKKIPIKILGKSLLSGIPHDILDSFQVLLNLPREEFFKQFMAAQMLLYPHACRYHSHNVPIEAIYAGMPVIFRTETPTFLECDHPPEVFETPMLIGASRSNSEFMELALATYGDEKALQGLVDRQKRLISPYSRVSVDAEMSHIRELIPKISRISPSNISAKYFPLSLYPSAEYYRVHREIVNASFIGWLGAFHAGPMLNRVGMADIDGLPLRLTAEYLSTILGHRINAEPVYFEVGYQHDFALEIFYQGKGEVSVVWEVWVNNGIVYREESLLELSSDQLSTKSAWLHFCGDVPFHVAVYARAVGDVRAAAGRISHQHTTKTNSRIKMLIPHFLDMLRKKAQRLMKIN